MTDKPPITSVAGQVLSDEDETPEARRLAGAVLNQAREDQADEAQSEPSTPVEGDVVAVQGGEIDQESAVQDSDGTGQDEPTGASPERRAELEAERTNLQRKHTKMLDEPGYARTLLAVQARLAEIDKELDE